MTMPESFRETWRNIAMTFFKLGITSYGGPAIMGIMQTELQEHRQWVCPCGAEIVHPIELCTALVLAAVAWLPGPAAVCVKGS